MGLNSVTAIRRGTESGPEHRGTNVQGRHCRLRTETDKGRWYKIKVLLGAWNVPTA